MIWGVLPFKMAIPFFLLSILVGCYNHDAYSVRNITNPNGTVFSMVIEVETKDKANVFIEYWKKGNPDSVYISDTSKQKSNHSIAIVGLQQNQQYEYKVCMTGEASSGKLYTFKTGELPLDVSEQVRLINADFEKLPDTFKKGYLILYRRDVPGLLFIVNTKGEIVSYQRSDSTGYKVASYTPSQTLLSLLAPLTYPTSYGNEILERKMNGDTILYLKKGENDFTKTIHHELLYNNKQQLVTLTLDERVVDLSKIRGSKSDTVRGDGILVLDKKGKKIWEWSVFDVLDPLSYPNILKEKKDWLHANSLYIDNDGNYVVSFYLGKQIWKINAQSGKVIWKLGAKGDFKLDKGDWFSESHSVFMNDSRELILFENGTINKRSSIRVYQIDEAKHIASLKNKIQLQEYFYSERMGSAYPLNDSLWLVCTAQSGNIIVVDKQGSVLWRLRTAFTPYRAYFIAADKMNLATLISKK